MSETLAQTKARLTAFIQENAPNLDLSPGSVFNELLVGMETQIQNSVKSDITTLSAGQTVAAVQANTEDTYNPIIDQLASNYDVVRNQGQAASGTLRITVSSATVNTVVTGTGFIQPGLQFVYTTTADVTPVLDSNMFYNGDNTWYFDVNVVANSVGTDKTVADGTQFELQTPAAILPFVTARAFGSFSQGQNAETDKELVARFRAGMSAKNMGSTDAIYSVLQDTFPGFQSVYLADHNDPLNLRGSNNPLGLKLPGCVDVYLRNSVSLQNHTFTMSGNYEGGGIYTLPITPSSQNGAYGFYKVLSVQVHDPGVTDGSAIMAPFSALYGRLNTTYNSIHTIKEARFSVYQTSTVRVTYTPVDENNPPTFDVTVLLPANLKAVQDLLNAEATRLPNADYLAKGVIPCVVSVYASLVVNNPTTFDIVALKSDIFNYINSLSVGQPIAVSKIINLCHKYDVLQVRMPVVLKGTMIVPNHTNNSGGVNDYTVALDGTDTLSIPDLPEYGANKNNTAFFTNYYTADAQEGINIVIQ